MDSTSTVDLPLVFDDGILLLDINMGDGSFIESCFKRHVAMAYGFEGDEQKFIDAENKLADYVDYCKLYQQKICRSDKFNEADATRFDFIVSHLPVVDVLRISCGKELYPILMTSKHLDKIGSIIGDVLGTTKPCNASKSASDYGVGKLLHPKMKDLKKHLEINGFNVSVSKDNKKFVAYKDNAMTFTLSNTPK